MYANPVQSTFYCWLVRSHSKNVGLNNTKKKKQNIAALPLLIFSKGTIEIIG